jgi:hypothetical protein
MASRVILRSLLKVGNWEWGIGNGGVRLLFFVVWEPPRIPQVWGTLIGSL